MRPGALLVLAALGSGAWSPELPAVEADRTMKDRVVFGRDCAVYARPFVESRVLCRRATGDEISAYREAENSFYQVKSLGCTGYTPDACVSQEKRRWESRNPAGVVTRDGGPFRIALELHGAGLLASVEGATQGSSGVGFGAGYLLGLPLGRRFQISLRFNYQVLQLTHTVDGTGVIADPTPARFSQRVPHLGLGLGVSYRLNDTGYPRGHAPQWWVDAGGEYLVPLSARQEDQRGNVITFTPTDRPVFAVLGLSADLALSRNFSLLMYLQGLYNVAAAQGSRLMSGRLAGALSWNL